jgi:DNA-binding GntR family transcriptional regulator
MSILSREPLRDQVRRVLLEWLLTGELEPGAGISEPMLAERIGVSRTPLREALLRLEFEGLLESRPGKGFSVRPLSPDTAEDLYRLAGTLEVQALRDSGIPSEDIMDEMADMDARRRTERDTHDAGTVVGLDQEWHAKLVAGCSNRELRRVLDLVRNRLYRYEYIFADDFERLGAKGLEHHDRILAALRAGDLEEACDVLKRHWEMGAESRSAWLRKVDHVARSESGAAGG